MTRKWARHPGVTAVKTIYNLLTELTGSYFIWSKAVVSVVVAFLWNYQMQRFFVYRNHHLTRHQ